MSNLMIRPNEENGGRAFALPRTRVGEINVRAAVASDLEFIDYLQKMHGHMVGFACKKQLEKNIADGDVVIAEQVGDGGTGGGTGVSPVGVGGTGVSPVGGSRTAQTHVSPIPVGYCIYKDNYLKRDEVGICYQLNVLPMRHRGLVGATIIQSVFERLPRGVKLFCCWCAQDIQANFFWESIGFVPLAFRTGSRSKQRIHIFWQRRIREDDDSTPYWYPYKTANGAVREDRVAIPIPPGVHWRDPMPVVLPEVQELAAPEMPKQLPGGAPVKSRPEQASAASKATKAQVAAVARSKSKHLGGVQAGKAAIISRGGLRYVERADAADAGGEVEQVQSKPKRAPKPRVKNDPVLEKKARELRDVYLEQVNVHMLLPPGASGKYDVSRQLGSEAAQSASSSKVYDAEVVQVHQLPPAA